MTDNHVTFTLNDDPTLPLFTLRSQESPPDVLAMFQEMYRWIAEIKEDINLLKNSKVVYIGDKKMAKKKAPLGSGKRFKAVEESARKSGAENPAAVAAKAGMKKLGKERFEKLAQAGKKRAEKGKSK